MPVIELPRGWTIGCELELSDLERDVPLPGRSTWDCEDWTIVNSNGVANDPKGKMWKFGGEINTEPTSSIDAQVNVIDAILQAACPKAAVNYRANFHVHVCVPRLALDVPRIQKLARYLQEHETSAFEMVDPIPPVPDGLLGSELKGAQKRFRHRSQSHHKTLTAERYSKIFSAKTPAEIHRAHGVINSCGVLWYRAVSRCGVNLRALWETHAATVECRHFSMSLDLHELSQAMQWCVAFLDSGLGDQVPPDKLIWPDAKFPRQPLYDHWLETRYLATSRREQEDWRIRATLKQWAKEGTL